MCIRDSCKDSDLGLGTTWRVDPRVKSAVNSGMDSEVTLQRLRDALGSTLKWTRAAYDSENATFLDKSTVAVKKDRFSQQIRLGSTRAWKGARFPWPLGVDSDVDPPSPRRRKRYISQQNHRINQKIYYISLRIRLESIRASKRMRLPSQHFKRKFASGSSRSVNLAQKYVKLDCGRDSQTVAKKHYRIPPIRLLVVSIATCFRNACFLD